MIKSKKDKWSKYLYMSDDPNLIDYLPKTLLLNKHNFMNKMDQLSEVILKPVGSYGGNGIIQVCKKNNYYEIHWENNKRNVKSLKNTYDLINRIKRPTTYIMQKRINLAKIGGQPFDIRVMVQRKVDGPWEITGKLVKVAGPGYFISNYTRSNGTILTLNSALNRTSIHPKHHRSITNNINRVALSVVNRLSTLYPDINTFGLDLGIDETGKVWIIEANLLPAFFIFNLLKDKSMYQRIKSYKYWGQSKKAR